MQSNPQTQAPSPNPKAGSFSCPVCGRGYQSFAQLIAHMPTHRVDFIVKYNPPRVELVSGNANGSGNGMVATTPRGIVYEDWNNSLQVLQKAYDAKLFVLVIGPKGTGKTTLVRKFAETLNKPLYTINFSLRTKESHLIGMQTLENGTTRFAMGIIPKSMQEGAILYLDELNAAEPDVLLRLDEALDDRRELNIKEAGEVVRVKAHPDWFVIATINPLSHAGTKELPPQLLSRFPVRIYLDYPPDTIELKIVSLHVGGLSGSEAYAVKLAIGLANKLRELAKVEELYYSPSIRETIAFAKLVKSGVNPKTAAEIVFANAYWQWGAVAYEKVRNLIASMFGEKAK